MHGGEVFIPKIPSTKITGLAQVIAPSVEWDVIGIRPGEKLHELLIHEDEARSTIELEDMFVVQPSVGSWFGYDWQEKGKPLPDGYRYASNTNPLWLDESQIREYTAPIENEMSNRAKY